MSEYARLLFCHTCKSVDQLPDYSGPAEHDYYLKHRAGQHQFPDGTPHRGLLGRVENKPEYINAAIDEMENTVNAGEGAGLGQVYYDLRDNYQAEAMTCWKRHGRTENCDEYRSDRMRLWIDTKAERRAEGLSVSREDRPSIWLCDHCPVHSVVSQRKNKAKGLYDRQ